MGLKKFSATLKYESTGCVQYGEIFNSRGHETGNSALCATIEKLAWLAAVGGIDQAAQSAFKQGLEHGLKHRAKINAEQDANEIPWTHRMKTNGGYEIGYFGAEGFIKTHDDVGSLETAKSIVDSHNAAKGFK